MVDNYSNRELDHMFKDIKDSLNLILKQTTEHNGRMTKAEKTIYGFRIGLSVAGVLTTVVILPLIVYFYTDLAHRIDNVESIFKNNNVVFEE